MLFDVLHLKDLFPSTFCYCTAPTITYSDQVCNRNAQTNEMPRNQDPHPCVTESRNLHAPVRQCNTTSFCSLMRDYDAAAFKATKALGKVQMIRIKFAQSGVVSDDLWNTAYTRTDLLWYALRDAFAAAVRLGAEYNGFATDTHNSRGIEWLHAFEACVEDLRPNDQKDAKSPIIFGKALYRILMLADFIMKTAERLVQY